MAISSVAIIAALALVSSISACRSQLALARTPLLRTPVSQQVVTATLPYTGVVDPSTVITFTVSDDPEAVSQSELLAVYKDLVEANKQAANKAGDTMDLVMKIASWSVAVIGALSVIIGMVGAKNFFDARNAISSVRKIKRSANSTEQEIELLEKRAETLQEDLRTLRQDIDADSSIVERLHALDDVDRCAMKLFGDDVTKRIAARKGLLQRVKSPDPVVRRECIRVFAEMPNYVEEWSAEEQILAELKRLAEKDEESGVRKEAEHALEVWLQGTAPSPDSH